MRSSSDVCTVHFKRAFKCAALIRADEHTNHARPNGGTVGSAAVGYAVVSADHVGSDRGPVRGASVIGTNCRANRTAHTAPLCCAERATLRNAVCCANHVNPDGRANRRSVSGPDRRMRLERVSDP